MQERVRLREEQKVRGVNLGATILDAEPEPMDGCEDLSDDFQNGEPDDELDLLNSRLEKKSGSNFRRSSKEEFRRASAFGGSHTQEEEDRGAEEEPDQADIFTGKITRPSDYEEIPFEEDELEEVKTVLLREEEADRAG